MSPVREGPATIKGVVDAHRRRNAREPPADVHQTAKVAANDHFGLGAQDVLNLLFHQRFGKFWILDAKGAAKTAADLTFGHLDELQSGTAGK